MARGEEVSATARRGRVWPWTVGAIAVLIAAGAVVAVVVASNAARRTGVTAPSAESTATAQAIAVSDFLTAYVKGDATAIEAHVTARSRPWTAPAVHLPAGVSAQDAAAALAPARDGTSLVIDVPFVVNLRLTGDEKAPSGTVTVVVTRSGSSPQEVSVGVVLTGGRWLVDTIGGVTAADGIARVAP